MCLIMSEHFECPRGAPLPCSLLYRSLRAPGSLSCVPCLWLPASTPPSILSWATTFLYVPIWPESPSHLFSSASPVNWTKSFSPGWINIMCNHGYLSCNSQSVANNWPLLILQIPYQSTRTHHPGPAAGCMSISLHVPLPTSL